MKFCHMSDCHIGSWSNHPDMRDFPMNAFDLAANGCIKEGVDFIIISGDLFDTSIPAIDAIRRAASTLRKCKEHGISVYAIPGSHDYSPTGKTMMSVLEDAGLLVDVCKFEFDNGKMKLKFTTDKKTGAKITGIMGKKGSLDVNYYKNIDRSIEKEEGFKIFVFHAGLEEERPEAMKSLAVSKEDLPKNFNYYAGGHIHKQFIDKERMIVFPGELFPTSFDELEDYSGRYVVAEAEIDRLMKYVKNVEWKSAKLFDVAAIKLDVSGKGVDEVESELRKNMESIDLSGKILLIKLFGVLESGRPSDIDFKSVVSKACEKGALIVKKSTGSVVMKEFSFQARKFLSQEQIEKELIDECKEQLKISGINDIEGFVKTLASVLSEEKKEDETTATFEERIKSSALRVVGL